jgi:hypothetical protein
MTMSSRSALAKPFERLSWSITYYAYYGDGLLSHQTPTAIRLNLSPRRGDATLTFGRLRLVRLGADGDMSPFC